MKNFYNRLSKLPWSKICFILLVILFFSFGVILTYDSGHYLSYVSIFEGESPASSWDIVRGPVFPIIIHLFNILFGESNMGLLIGIFIFYLIFIYICYKLLNEICENYKHKRLIKTIALAVLIANPLILGYFHVLLTEFVIITVSMLNILMAYRWIFIKHNKKILIAYAVYFVFSVIFCYHLKQPYLFITLAPLITASIISIVKNHHWKNILYRFGVIGISSIFLLFSIFAWNSILDGIGADKDSGRDTSSIFSQSILTTYEIPYDKDGDSNIDKASTMEAIDLFVNEFFHHPDKITSIYFKNYCALASICKIATLNNHDYFSTTELTGLDLFENATIGYSTYTREENLFPMRENMMAHASVYATSSSTKSPLAKVMRKLSTPTNILFKLAVVAYPIFLIFIIAIHHKDKKRKFTKLFYLNIILLVTAAAHMIISAGVGLIIDRYAIEAFIPSLLGMFGSVTYSYLVLKKSVRKKIYGKKK